MNPARACAPRLAGPQRHWAIERKSHVYGAGRREWVVMFFGLNARRRKLLAGYSSASPRRRCRGLLAVCTRISPEKPVRRPVAQSRLHSVPYFGGIRSSSPTISQTKPPPPSRPHLPGPDSDRSMCSCYSNADIRTGEEADEIFPSSLLEAPDCKVRRQLSSSTQSHTYQVPIGSMPRASLLTLRRRSPSLLAEVDHLPPLGRAYHHARRAPSQYATLGLRTEACPRQRT